jgi:predicted transcriptional regulator
MSNREALIDQIQTCVLRVERILITSREQHTDATAAFEALKAMAAVLAPSAAALLHHAEKEPVTPKGGQ